MFPGVLYDSFGDAGNDTTLKSACKSDEFELEARDVIEVAERVLCGSSEGWLACGGKGFGSSRLAKTSC